LEGLLAQLAPAVSGPRRLVLQPVGISTLCQQGVEFLPMASWKAAKVDGSCAWQCKESEVLRCFVIPHFDKVEPLVMRNCCHNDMAALRNRYLKESDNDVCYEETIVDDILEELACDILDVNGGLISPFSLPEFVQTRTGSARKRYDKAVQQVQSRGFDPLRDSKIKCFIKNEKYSEMKPPRAIMGRDPVFNLLYGLFTLPLEKQLPKLKCFAKGKDYFERGAWIEDYYGKCRFVANDYSKFESTQREKLLRHVELGLWKRVLSPLDFDRLLPCFELKMAKRGVTGNGIKFDFYACRGSGDMDTGLFNSIVNYVACRYFEKVNQTGDRDFVVDGDDSVIAIPNNHGNCENTFVQFGLDAKLEYLDDPNSVEFCSAKFVEYHHGKFVLCPNIRKICNNVGTLINKNFQHSVGQYYYSLGFMYRTMFPNLPFFHQLSHFLMGITQNAKVRVNLDMFRDANPTFLDAFKSCEGDQVYRVVDVSRFELGLSLAFGMSRAELNMIYDWMSSTVIDVSGRDKKFSLSGPSCLSWQTSELLTVQASMETMVRNRKADIFRLRYRYVR
jgi:hypothetical protein